MGVVMNKVLFVVLFIHWIVIQGSQGPKTTVINISAAKTAAEPIAAQTVPRISIAPSAIGEDTARAMGEWGGTAMSVEQERKASQDLNAKQGKGKLGLPDENDPEIAKLIARNATHRKVGSVSVRRATDGVASNTQAAAGVVGKSRRSTDGGNGPGLVNYGRPSLAAAAYSLQPPSAASAASAPTDPSPRNSVTTTPRLQGIGSPMIPIHGTAGNKATRDTNGTPSSARDNTMVEISVTAPTPHYVLPVPAYLTRPSTTVAQGGIETSRVQVTVTSMDRNSSSAQKPSTHKNCSCCCACCFTYFCHSC